MIVRELVLLGAGGHAREIAASISRLHQVSSDESQAFAGYLADWIPDSTQAALPDLPLLGPIEALPNLVHRYLVAVGNPIQRRAIARRMTGCNDRLTNVIDPSALIGPRVRIGTGVYIGLGAIITVDAQIADHVHLNVRSSVHHDVVIMPYSTVGPGSVICGSVLIGEAVTIGAGATILPGVHVGDEAVIGAGAVVTKNVAAHAVVVGVPAR